ncbi:YadA C-terminal domain-containing protein [Salmonella enterica]|nr:YadA C-terminal domain-containing protein [Salmonella enterica]
MKKTLIASLVIAAVTSPAIAAQTEKMIDILRDEKAAPETAQAFPSHGDQVVMDKYRLHAEQTLRDEKPALEPAQTFATHGEQTVKDPLFLVNAAEAPAPVVVVDAPAVKHEMLTVRPEKFAPEAAQEGVKHYEETVNDKYRLHAEQTLRTEQPFLDKVETPAPVTVFNGDGVKHESLIVRPEQYAQEPALKGVTRYEETVYDKAQPLTKIETPASVVVVDNAAVKHESLIVRPEKPAPEAVQTPADHVEATVYDKYRLHAEQTLRDEKPTFDKVELVESPVVVVEENAKFLLNTAEVPPSVTVVDEPAVKHESLIVRPEKYAPEAVQQGVTRYEETVYDKARPLTKIETPASHVEQTVFTDPTPHEGAAHAARYSMRAVHNPDTLIHTAELAHNPLYAGTEIGQKASAKMERLAAVKLDQESRYRERVAHNERIGNAAAASHDALAQGQDTTGTSATHVHGSTVVVGGPGANTRKIDTDVQTALDLKADKHLLTSVIKTRIDNENALNDKIKAEEIRATGVENDHETRITTNDTRGQKNETRSKNNEQALNDKATKQEFKTLQTEVTHKVGEGVFNQRSAVVDQRFIDTQERINENKAEQDKVNKAVAGELKKHGDRLDDLESNTRTNFNKLEQQQNKDRKEFRAGIAGAVALSQIPQVQADQRGNFGMAVGTFNGENAIAAGVSTRLSSSVTLKSGLSWDTQGNVGAGAGIAVGW